MEVSDWSTKEAEKLTALGLADGVYYLVLIAIGVAAMVVLFGVLSSSATYEGAVLGGSLKLGGSVVGAALVVFGAYLFIPRPGTFPLTVFVHGEGGKQDLVLRNSGDVALELGPDARREQIGEKGQAFFPSIPASFRGHKVPAWVESDAYEAVDPSATLDGTSVYLQVRKRVHHYELAGTVFDASSNPLSGVHIAVPEYRAEAETYEDGGFRLQIDSTETQHMVDLIAEKPGYQTKRLSPTLEDTGLNFFLKKSP